RQHILLAINDGLSAKETMQGCIAGVLFTGPDEPTVGSFIPFDHLGYNSTYGYFDMRRLVGVQSDCTNENTETIHEMVNPYDDWRPLVWLQAEAGITVLLGNESQVADLYQALKAYLEHGTLGEPLDEEEVGSHIEWLQAADAAFFASKANPERFPNPTNPQLQNSIRVAATNDRIRTRQGASGRTYYHREAVEEWARREENRGRPRIRVIEAPVVETAPARDPKANRVKVYPGQYQVGDVVEGRTITGFGKTWSEGTLSAGQLWEPCHRVDCEREPVCVQCFRCERHCHCDTVEYCYAYFG
ncbi:MAG: hypothetical protein ACREO2_07315, partial [Arenimonas sp.]